MAAYRSSSNQRRYTPYSERRMAKKSRNKLIFTLILAVVLLYFFIFWFLPTIVGGLSFLNKTNPKISDSTDKAAIAPPVLNIPFEATNSSPIQIKGYSSSNSQVEIYVDDELKSTVQTQSDGSFVSDDIELSVGRNNITGKTVDGKDNKSYSSKNIVVIFDNEKPKLEITSPQDNQEIVGGDKKVKVSGITDPNDAAVVTINGTRIILNSDGGFTQTLEIGEGETNFNIKAIDNAGNLTELNRKVTWKPS